MQIANWGRRGISLTEVLIAMGILTLGLLGVMALFPVGGYYMQQAEISDRGAAVARSVMNDIVARGVLDPNAWQMYVPPAAPLPPIPGVPSADTGPSRTYSRSVGRALAQQMTAVPVLPGAIDPRPKVLSQQFGTVFVMDPLGLGATTSLGTNPKNGYVAPFPAAAYNYPLAGYYTAAPWRTWDDGSGRAEFWPVRRVTLRQATPVTGMAMGRMNAELAESLFGGTDDLAFELPEQGDRPAVQPWQMSGTAPSAQPLSRQWVGDYSWLVSVVPTSSDAYMALGMGTSSHAYDVSVVVFYKRQVAHSLTLSALPTAGEDLQKVERVVGARIVSTGMSGGELRLDQLGEWSGVSPFDRLRSGQWLFLCGPHPTSTDQAPRFVANWYQVMAIDSEGAGIINNPNRQRVVTLRGPRWPWQPSTTAGDLSNNLCVGIFPGAVAVHTKTLRLEGRRGGSWGGDTAWGTGQTQQPQGPQSPWPLLNAP